MAAQFESLSYPFIIMFSIPFCIQRCVDGIILYGNQFECDVAFSGIMLIGIVVEERYRTHRPSRFAANVVKRCFTL